MKLILILLVALFSFFALARSETAYFAFKTHGSQHDFIFKLTDDGLIKSARAILSGEEQLATHVMGRIRKVQASYNPHYSYHFDEKTISFFSMAIEVCDATLQYTEDYLDEACGAFLPGCFFCPWSSVITKEVKINELN
ncbi:hypothetical protein RB653_006583 [Dictyostelium firmibasis]|uniref:BP74 N-terminal domain-containing protein n=1 Tax=Dictyostelium firmibasis TaxID=79012 RepID=A0AAN7YWD0_9MYCE